MRPRISVLTASFNVAGTLPALYESLARQTFQDFEWVVADGASTDGTVDLLREFSAQSPWVRFVSEPDGGIYHALNKALDQSSSEYYVVAGADDFFEPQALANYADSIEKTNADVVLARVYRAGKVIGGFAPNRGWIGPSRAFGGSHSVGILFRKDLHRRFGKYSRRFPLLADAYFLKTLLRSGEVRFIETDFVAGTFVEGGATTGNELQLLAENWQIQMLTERSPLLQMLLFVGKLLVRYSSVSKELGLRKTNDLSGR